MNFPAGGVPIWPPLYDVLLATPARVLEGSSATPDAIERGAAWVPLLLGVGAILFAGLLGRQVFGDIGGVVVALFVAVCPGHITWTQYGHTDQHAAESFFGMLSLWLFLRCRSRRTPVSDITAGVALAAAILAWQGAIYWGAIFALSLTLEAAGPAPTEKYLRTLQSRLYDFDGGGLTMSTISVPPLVHFRLRYNSATAINRWGKLLAWMKVFEIVD